jgi:penicillin-binding protein 1C
MNRVSGTSGAAPVWRDVMLALHADRAGRAPPRPAGLEARAIVFADGTEPPRPEYFLPGTAQARIESAPPASRRPRIANPVSGAVYALDPDIPLPRQRIRLTAVGAAGGERLELDGKDVGLAAEGPMVLPAPGQHRLALLDEHGKVLDRTLFTVR